VQFTGPVPAPRRAHTAVLYRDKIWVFGGGNGLEALNDVWTLDVNVPMERMRWRQVETIGPKPHTRGYHTANLVGHIMIIYGGSDGKECFSDIWALNLGAYFFVVCSFCVGRS
jgi:Rab9 effector protein with kelch motifs